MSSNNYFNKIILKQKKIDPYINFKPERKDDNYHFSNSISYNMIKSLTMFKNKEIDHSILNEYLFGNLAFLITKKNITFYKKLEKEKKTNNSPKLINNKRNNLNSLTLNYDSYIPTNRLPILDNKKNNIEKNNIEKNNIEKNNEKLNSKGLKRTSTKLEKNNTSNEKSKFFKPFGNDFVSHKKAIRKLSVNSSVYSLGSNSNSVEDIDTVKSEEKESNNEFNLVSKETINDDNLEEEFLSLIKKNCRFPKYKELTEYIGCPLTDSYSNKTRYHIFMNILNNFLNMDDYDPSEPENKNTLNFNKLDEISIIEKKVFIDNSNYNYDLYKKNSDEKLLQKNINSMTVNGENNNNISQNRTTLSKELNNNYDESSEKDSLFELLEKEKNVNKKSVSKLQEKIKVLLPKSYRKYLEKMNAEYIVFMYAQYNNIYTKCQENKMFTMGDDTIVKKCYIQYLKKLLLEIGISQKRGYEKILKNQIYKNAKFLSFEQFMSNFEQILLDNKCFEIEKYLLLLYILPHENNDSFLRQIELNQFFDLMECEFICEPQICQILSEKLIAKYESLYKVEELKNIHVGKYRFRKIKTVLVFFLD